MPTLYVVVTRQRDRGPRHASGAQGGERSAEEAGKENLAGQPA
ncbi:unnamed protein product [[Actinomadura] parvosata subsp. kistnae]|nr:hypothetical protein [Nonomuraea sp. ATCC 55076]SPL89495.1 unnamed protein product [Actinomadura parvosata subsp. kistnae]